MELSATVTFEEVKDSKLRRSEDDQQQTEVAATIVTQTCTPPGEQAERSQVATPDESTVQQSESVKSEPLSRARDRRWLRLIADAMNGESPARARVCSLVALSSLRFAFGCIVALGHSSLFHLCYRHISILCNMKICKQKLPLLLLGCSCISAALYWCVLFEPSLPPAVRGVATAGLFVSVPVTCTNSRTSRAFWALTMTGSLGLRGLTFLRARLILGLLTGTPQSRLCFTTYRFAWLVLLLESTSKLLQSLNPKLCLYQLGLCWKSPPF